MSRWRPRSNAPYRSASFFARNSAIGPRCSIRFGRTICSKSSSWSWSISAQLRRRGAFIVANPPLSGYCLPGKTRRLTPELDELREKVGGSGPFRKSGAAATKLGEDAMRHSKKKGPRGTLKLRVWWT